MIDDFEGFAFHLGYVNNRHDLPTGFANIETLSFETITSLRKMYKMMRMFYYVERRTIRTLSLTKNWPIPNNRPITNNQALIYGACYTRKASNACVCSRCLIWTTKHFEKLHNMDPTLLKPKILSCERCVITVQGESKLNPRQRKPLDWMEPTSVLRVVPGATYIKDVFHAKTIQEKTILEKSTSIISKRRDLAYTKGSSDWKAEVVVLHSINGAEGHQSRRAQHILRCMGVDFFSINGEAHLLWSDSPEGSLTSTIYQLGRIELDVRKRARQAAIPLLLPQVLIDGVLIGDDYDLQDLVEDNDLEYILSREKCPRCLGERTLASICRLCGAKYQYVISPELLQSHHKSFVISSLHQSGAMTAPTTWNNFEDIIQGRVKGY